MAKRRVKRPQPGSKEFIELLNKLIRRHAARTKKDRAAKSSKGGSTHIAGTGGVLGTKKSIKPAVPAIRKVNVSVLQPLKDLSWKAQQKRLLFSRSGVSSTRRQFAQAKKDLAAAGSKGTETLYVNRSGVSGTRRQFAQNKKDRAAKGSRGIGTRYGRTGGASGLKPLKTAPRLVSAAKGVRLLSKLGPKGALLGIGGYALYDTLKNRKKQQENNSAGSSAQQRPKTTKPPSPVRPTPQRSNPKPKRQPPPAVRTASTSRSRAPARSRPTAPKTHPARPTPRQRDAAAVRKAYNTLRTSSLDEAAKKKKGLRIWAEYHSKYGSADLKKKARAWLKKNR
ncbi:hypothetical protein OMCYN_01641 [cyanobiont of Ornithocercus magnificus]|nr:hypothetical protein OMCYN_01641 [cyanobiont of Ornithocercus magnificus]